MSDSASEPKETTRHIVFHRRRTPVRRFKRFITRLTFTCLASFFLISIIVDTLHPRALTTQSVVDLAKLLQNGSAPSLNLFIKASIPSRHAVDHRSTAITGNPPALITRHLLYWTPVESLTLLIYPPSPPLLHHAVPVNLHLYPLSKVSITLLPSQSTSSIPRFTPFVIHPEDKVSILEHADGFLPARNLQTAIYSATVTMHPRLLWDAFTDTTSLLFAYVRRCLPTITYPEPLAWARRISNTVRERRLKRAAPSKEAP